MCDMSWHGWYQQDHVHTGSTSNESHSIHTCLHCVDVGHSRLTAHLHSIKSPPYVINLDPAVHHVPYPANIGDHLLLLFISLSFTDTERHGEVQTGDVSTGTATYVWTVV